MVREFFGDNAVTVVFEWNPPLGDDLGSVVDEYSIIISPGPISHPPSIRIAFPRMIVLLNYNVEYTTSIFSINCAGISQDSLIYYFRYGKYTGNCNGHLQYSTTRHHKLHSKSQPHA